MTSAIQRGGKHGSRVLFSLSFPCAFSSPFHVLYLLIVVAQSFSSVHHLLSLRDGRSPIKTYIYILVVAQNDQLSALGRRQGQKGGVLGDIAVTLIEAIVASDPRTRRLRLGMRRTHLARINSDIDDMLHRWIPRGRFESHFAI